MLMDLKEIYRPISEELEDVDGVLRSILSNSDDKFIKEIGAYLLETPGKRMRPALVLLSAAASGMDDSPDSRKKMIEIAASMELVHMASLIHDDVIDHAVIRHSRPTINARWGNDVAITLGDYLYSEAFDMVSICGNTDILRCISSATKSMCEGELIQVCERDNLDMLRERYITIVKKKTASLYTASCRSGALLSGKGKELEDSLDQYGMNLGITFQITDDYLDIMSDEKESGKKQGHDISIGEITLPVLNLLEALSHEKREELKAIIGSKVDAADIEMIKSEMISTDAALRTKEAAFSFAEEAKENIRALNGSPYKDSLISLSDFIMERGFSGVRSREKTGTFQS